MVQPADDPPKASTIFIPSHSTLPDASTLADQVGEIAMTTRVTEGHPATTTI